MPLNPKTKLAVGHGALLIISIIIAMIDHFYVGKLYHASIKVEDTILKLDYLSRFQLTLERSLMPPNDYLIHGHPVEKTNFTWLTEQMDFMFKTAGKLDLTGEEQALLKDSQTKFDDVKRLAVEIFAIENPAENNTGGELMERMDALAEVVQKNMDTINVTRYEKTIRAINDIKSLYDLEHKVYWIFIIILTGCAVTVAVSIHFIAEELERKAVKSEVGKREWEKTFDIIDDFITIHDKDYNLIRVNKATAKRFNTTPQALIGKKCYELFHCASEPHPLCPHKKTMETWMPASIELNSPHLGGIFLTSTYPLINEKGDVYATIHIAKDITEMRKADQKVREEAEVNKALLGVAKFMSSIMDEETILQEVVRITPTLVKCDRCVLFLWDDKQRVFLSKACHGLEEDNVPIFKAMRFKTGDFKVLDEVKRRKISMVIEDPTGNPLMPSELVKMFKIMSNLHMPIISRGEVIGILGMDYTKEHHKFSSNEIAIVEGIAAQTGIALENARLYRESIDKLMELSQRVETIQDR